MPHQKDDLIKLESLRTSLREYQHEYHVNNNALISDDAYDYLMQELRTLEKKLAIHNGNSPDDIVGGAVDSEKFRKVKHSSRMLSLQDVFSFEEILKWLHRIQAMADNNDIRLTVEEKLDGLALSLIYHQGSLRQAVTRGDGNVGEDVTHNALVLKSIPKKLLHIDKASAFYQDIFEVRGEVIIQKSDFLRLNQSRSAAGLEIFANHRNSAAGSMRQKEVDKSRLSYLSFFAYGIFSPNNIDTHSKQHQILQDLGFQTGYCSPQLSTEVDLISTIKEMSLSRDKLSYYIDGLVINVADKKLYQSLGVVGKFPRGAVAYKFPPVEVTTTMTDIRVSVGRTGAVTPYAVLTPVFVDGSTISRATLHNIGEIERKDLMIGDTVIVRKAGDIIPEIVGPIKGLRPKLASKFVMPSDIDGVKVIIDPNQAIARLATLDLDMVLAKRIEHLVSTPAFNIDGLGEKNIDLLIEEGLLENMASIFALRLDDLITLPRFGQKLAMNILGSIDKSKTIALDKFIYSLGIRYVGEITARLMAERFISLSSLLTTNNLENELLIIDGIGDKVATSVADYFNQKENRDVISQMLDYGVMVQDIEKTTSGPLINTVWALSGSLAGLSRKEATDMIVSAGGTLSKTISTSTTHLLLGENAGSKLDEARSRGVKIISLTQFQKMLS